MQNIQMTLGSGPGTPEADQTFQTLRARLALAGHVLNPTDPSDGTCTSYVTRWGMARFLEQVGGAHA
jgi:hypothetical protein